MPRWVPVPKPPTRTPLDGAAGPGVIGLSDRGAARFFGAVVDWQRQHGRHGLPWQGTHEPYRVWLSEIMLQQTQVSTVLDYYPRFLQRFPDVHALAGASLDEVLALWSGLGYYSRARHLHRCAQAVVEAHGGVFPGSAQALQALPGIGPSTAAAMAAFCFGERVSILDGNVKRVLSRLLAFEGDLAQAAQERRLWQIAQDLLPPSPSHVDMAAYTQGLMDLGAGLCTRTRPQCGACPAAGMCQGQAQGREVEFPVKTRKPLRKSVAWWLLVLRRSRDGAVWLEQRPPHGIWAGLHCMPVFESRDALLQALPLEEAVSSKGHDHPALRHALTHRELMLHPVEWEVEDLPMTGPGLWVVRPDDLSMGLPAPVRSWLEQALG